MKKILVLGDIHANYPALNAVLKYVNRKNIDWIVNTGDLLVYSTFPNETVKWFRKKNNCTCILGNTDKRVLNILNGKKLKRPKKLEKRVMYYWTSEILGTKNRKYLESLSEQDEITMESFRMGIFHGTSDDVDETLLPDSPDNRFHRLAKTSPHQIHMMGHTHVPYHKVAGGVHFINPGSVGRMFDGDNRASFAILKLSSGGVTVKHFRIPYPVERVTNGLKQHHLPDIYTEMFRKGRKLN